MLATRRCLAALLVLAASCAKSAPETGAAPASAERMAKNPDVISNDELKDPAVAATDAMNAIQLLRPSFFRTRGPQSIPRAGQDPASAPGLVRVSQDYGPLQALNILSAISVRTLVEVRYLNAVEAQARFGINANGGPVIVVLTTRQ